MDHQTHRFLDLKFENYRFSPLILTLGWLIRRQMINPKYRKLINIKRRLLNSHDPADDLLAPRYPQHDIGIGSYGGLNIMFDNAGSKLKMGKYCSVAMNVKVFLGGDHRSDWVSSYPFYMFDKAYSRPQSGASKGDVIIGNDVWLGRDSTIMSGVTIGDGAVVGAEAVVAKDVPPYGIVVGNPAKLVRLRFSESVVSRLLAIGWWDWPEPRIKAAMHLILNSDIESFLNAAEQGPL
jgi:chloramphenicol O-acetyltransferase type B